MTSNEDRAVWEADEEALYKARNATETASEPVRALPDATPAGEALVQQIAEAIRRTFHNGNISDWVPAAGRAVLPLVEAQVAEVTDEYDGILTRQGELLTRTVNILKGDPPELTSWSHHDVPELAQALRARAESAEAKVAKVEALVAEHDHCSGCPTPWWLRAALAPTTPAKELDHE